MPADEPIRRPDWPAPTTREEEAELSAVILAGGPGALEARNRLAAAHLAWAMKIAGRMARGLRMDPDDAFGAGCLGLVRAANLFDATTGYRFTTYATRAVKQGIWRERRRSAGAVRVPEDRPISSVGATVSLSQSEDGMSPLSDLMACGREPTPGDGGRLAEVRSEVGRLLDGLHRRERLVVERYFGIGDGPETITAIGERLGVSRERVSQLKNRGLRRMAKTARRIGA